MIQMHLILEFDKVSDIAYAKHIREQSSPEQLALSLFITLSFPTHSKFLSRLTLLNVSHLKPLLSSHIPKYSSMFDNDSLRFINPQKLSKHHCFSRQFPLLCLVWREEVFL